MSTSKDLYCNVCGYHMSFQIVSYNPIITSDKLFDCLLKDYLAEDMLNSPINPRDVLEYSCSNPNCLSHVNKEQEPLSSKGKELLEDLNVLDIKRIFNITNLLRRNYA